MARRSVPCTGCAATWTDRRARFCGRCGAPLGTRGLPTDAGSRTGPWWTTRRFAVVLAAATAAVLMVGTVAVTDGLSFGRRSDPEVALPTADVLPTGSRLEPRETAALRAQIDPDRLRCEPRGCELWRRAWTRESELMSLGDLVLLFDEGRLLALDGYTGEQRWVEPMDDLQPAGTLASPVGPGSWWSIATVEDAVVVGTRGHVVMVGDDGARRWALPVSGRHFWAEEVVDDRLLLHGEGSGSTFLAVIDLDDGSMLWEREGGDGSVRLHDDHVLLSDSRTIEVVQLEDGQVVWSHESTDDMALNDHSYRDVWLADGTVLATDPNTRELTAYDLLGGGQLWTRAYGSGGWPVVAGTWVGVPQPDAEDVVIVEIKTNRELATFENAVPNEWIEIDDTWVLLLAAPRLRGGGGDEQHQPGPRVVAIDRHGEVVWEHAIEPSRRCCSWMTTGEPGVVVVVTDDSGSGIREALRVEVATGALLEAGETVSESEFYASYRSPGGTTVTWDDRALTLRKDDRSARVFPSELWPHVVDGPLVFGNGTGLIGIQLMPDG